eukprot:485013-Prymnesium_polylepis.1
MDWLASRVADLGDRGLLMVEFASPGWTPRVVPEVCIICAAPSFVLPPRVVVRALSDLSFRVRAAGVRSQSIAPLPREHLKKFSHVIIWRTERPPPWPRTGFGRGKTKSKRTLSGR